MRRLDGDRAGADANPSAAEPSPAMASPGAADGLSEAQALEQWSDRVFDSPSLTATLAALGSSRLLPQRLARQGLCLSPSRFARLLRSDPDFPMPQFRGGGAFWRVGDLVRWLRLQEAKRARRNAAK